MKIPYIVKDHLAEGTVYAALFTVGALGGTDTFVDACKLVGFLGVGSRLVPYAEVLNENSPYYKQ